MPVNQEISRLFEIPSFNTNRVMFSYVTRGAVQSVTGLEVESRSTDLASRLIHIGIEAGDRVISIVKDWPLWNIVECAVLKSGAVHVPLPVSVSDKKLMSVTNTVEPVKILVDSMVQLRRIRNICSSLVDTDSICLVQDLEAMDNAKLQINKLNERINHVKPQHTAVILFTSGSTGKSKGVMLSHKNVLIAAEEFSKTDVFNGIKRSLSVLPLSHSAARKVNYACQLRGITVCYSAATVSLVKNLELFEAQHIALVPYLLQKIKDEITKNPPPHIQLQTVTCGGAHLPSGLWKWFDDLGIKVFEVYGLTETASLLTYSTSKIRRPNCVGKKAENVEFRITEKNELEVKGPTLLQEYILSDGSTKTALNDNGWFNTGDTVSIDTDGGIQIVGRTTRSYKTKRGNYVHPEEVERSLMSLPGVAEAHLINDSMEPMKAVIISTSGLCIDEIHNLIRQYNQGRMEDLQIASFSMLSQDSVSKFRKVGEIKPEKVTFTEMMKNQKFTKI